MNKIFSFPHFLIIGSCSVDSVLHLNASGTKQLTGRDCKQKSRGSSFRRNYSINFKVSNTFNHTCVTLGNISVTVFVPTVGKHVILVGFPYIVFAGQLKFKRLIKF